MSLRDKWVDKVDGVDDVLAQDINDIANGVIEIEDSMGDVDSALDAIIAIQNSLIGGDK